MSYLISSAIGLIGFYILIKSSSVFVATARKSVGLLNIMLSPLSDEEKLELVPKQTGGLVKSLLGSIAVLLSIGGASWLLWEFTVDGLSTVEAVVSYSIGASLPFFLIKTHKGSYSKTAQLLHQLILDNYYLHLRLFKREVKRNQIEKLDDFIIVSGLARAGTTSMLNTLMKLGSFS